MFTGDVPGGASDFLMAALHACGLATLPTSRAIDDGLRLNDVWMTAVARCAPPDNTLLPVEIRNCHPHLMAETGALPNARVYVALGRVAFEALHRLFAGRGKTTPRRPVFEHGAVYRYGEGLVLVASYHPSRQNTQTGKLTPVMLRQALRRAKTLAGPGPGDG
jgi:uracil-DNA glycosylase family 4